MHIRKILGFIPGLGQAKDALKNVDDKQIVYMECIIGSMTEEERKNPKLIDMSSRRRERIAKGSGRSITEVNRLRQALDQQIQMAKRLSGLDPKQMERMSKNPQSFQPQIRQSKGKGKNKGRFRY